MVNGGRVGPSEDVVRYARPKDVDGETLNGSAFERSSKDEDGVSVCRLGIFRADLAGDLEQIRAVMRTWLKLKPSGKFAQISVGDIEEVGREVSQTLSVVEDALAAQGGRAANPAHALIDGLPFQGSSIGSLSSELASDLLRLRVSALHPAV